VFKVLKALRGHRDRKAFKDRKEIRVIKETQA
jgi:hypothetical protein